MCRGPTTSKQRTQTTRLLQFPTARDKRSSTQMYCTWSHNIHLLFLIPIATSCADCQSDTFRCDITHRLQWPCLGGVAEKYICCQWPLTATSRVKAVGWWLCEQITCPSHFCCFMAKKQEELKGKRETQSLPYCLLHLAGVHYSTGVPSVCSRPCGTNVEMVYITQHKPAFKIQTP